MVGALEAVRDEIVVAERRLEMLREVEGMLLSIGEVAPVDVPGTVTIAPPAPPLSEPSYRPGAARKRAARGQQAASLDGRVLEAVGWGPMTAAAIADRLGVPEADAQAALDRLAADGEVERLESGSYRVASAC